VGDERREAAYLRKLKLSKVGAWVPGISKIRYISVMRCTIESCVLHFSVKIWNRISQIILEKRNTGKGDNWQLRSIAT